MLLHDVNPVVSALAGRFLGDANQSITTVSGAFALAPVGWVFHIFGLEGGNIATICIGAAQRKRQ
jgi:hypothetical protein